MADKTRYALQLMVKLPEPVQLDIPAARQPLAAVHMGWAADEAGRHVAGIAWGADAGMTEMLQLPPVIEESLGRANELQSRRDTALHDRCRNCGMPSMAFRPRQ